MNKSLVDHASVIIRIDREVAGNGRIGAQENTYGAGPWR